jgi:hypothetical protein
LTVSTSELNLDNSKVGKERQTAVTSGLVIAETETVGERIRARVEAAAGEVNANSRA